MLPFPAPPPHLRGATGRGVRIAVVDTGWDRTLADPRVVPGVGLVPPDDDFALLESADDHDRLGHGTSVAGLILRIAPEAEIVPVRVFGERLETSPEALCAGVAWAARAGVHLANLSLGTTLESARAPLRDACARALRAGVALVAAAPVPDAHPAALEGVIGVAAGRFASPWRLERGAAPIDLVAAGHDLPVRGLRGEPDAGSGASFAAPLATGIAALLLERHPGASPDELGLLMAAWMG